MGIRQDLINDLHPNSVAGKLRDEIRRPACIECGLKFGCAAAGVPSGFCLSAIDRRNRDRAAPAMSVVASMGGANYRESILSRSVLASRLCPFRGLLAVNLVWI